MKRLAARVESVVLALASLSRRRNVRVAALGAGLLIAATATSVDGYHRMPGATSPLADSTAASPAASSPDTTLSGPQAGAKNIVQVHNLVDQKLRIEGRVQLSGNPAPGVAPVNIAGSYSSCANCSTLAVAMQIVLISKSTYYAAPQNAATAVNYACTGCVTAAVADQWVISVDDPTQIPPRARQLANDLDAQLRAIRATAISVQDALQKLQSVVAEYNDLAASLMSRQSLTTDSTTPGATPAPEASMSPSPDSSGATPTATPSATQPDPSPTPTASESPSPTASP
jgi:hypothetical protein